MRREFRVGGDRLGLGGDRISGAGMHCILTPFPGPHVDQHGLPSMILFFTGVNGYIMDPSYSCGWVFPPGQGTNDVP